MRKPVGEAIRLQRLRALTGFTPTGRLGVGTIDCVLFGFFPTWRNVWNVLTKPRFVVGAYRLRRRTSWLLEN